MVAARVDRRRPKVGAGGERATGRKEEREKGVGCEGGKGWHLLELCCACGREEGNRVVHSRRRRRFLQAVSKVISHFLVLIL